MREKILQEGKSRMKPNAAGKKLTPEEFVLRALQELRKPGRKGIHVVYTNFNRAFKVYFAEEGLNPIEVTRQMAREDKIKIRPAKGGVRIFLPDEIEGPSIPESAEDVLKKMGL